MVAGGGGGVVVGDVRVAVVVGIVVVAVSPRVY